MPLTLQITEGVIPSGTAMVTVVPKDRTFSGGEEVSGAWIEWKTPGFAFTDRDIQIGCAKECTDVIYNLSGGKQPKSNIYFNVVHTVDGTWNMDGQAMTNEQLGEAISKG